VVEIVDNKMLPFSTFASVSYMLSIMMNNVCVVSRKNVAFLAREPVVLEFTVLGAL